MPRGSVANLGLITVAAHMLSASSTIATVNPSLCLVADEGCLAPGGIQVRLVLGQSDKVIVGGQVVVDYDPLALRLISANPGRACDPTSPFALKLFDDNNSVTGQVRCAIGINFLEGLPASTNSVTLACLSFAPVGDAADPTSLCLLEGLHPYFTMLVDDTGLPVDVDNSLDCPMGGPPAVLSCDVVDPDANCTCDPDTTDCHGLDTLCRTGVCNPKTTRCEIKSVNEGGPCDDNDYCTTLDRCSRGECIGEGCRNPALCAISNACLGFDPELLVRIRLGEGDRVIQAAQFSVHYDNTELAFAGVVPGIACDSGSPFMLELSAVIDQAAGNIFYAVGVGLGGPPPTRGPATVACLNFVDLGEPGGDVCLFIDSNPFSSILVDEFGQAVQLGDAGFCPSNRDPPAPRCADFEVCNIPTVSEWGLVAMTLLLLTTAKIMFGYSRPAPAPAPVSAGRPPD